MKEMHSIFNFFNIRVKNNKINTGGFDTAGDFWGEKINDNCAVKLFYRGGILSEFYGSSKTIKYRPVSRKPSYF